MNNLDQAREWAEKYQRHHVIGPEDEVAAVEVIRGLPDHWIDADKVREVLDRWAENPSPTSDEVAVLNDFEALLTPPLQTLAELIEAGDKPEDYQWMQAQVFSTATTLGIITGVDEYARSAIILFADGMAKNVPWSFITPLPGEPKLEWPGQEPSIIPQEPYMFGGHGPTEREQDPEWVYRFMEEPVNDPPCPEDVPAGEAWLVGIRTVNGIQNDQKFFGVRSSGGTWELFDVDEGWHSRWGIPSEITLISRLVPEVES